MPKRTTIYGSDRTNLMYTLIGKILDAGSIGVEELAETLQVSKREVTDAIRTISITESGTGYDYQPFLIDDQTLKSGTAEFNDYPVDLQVPRLSARQVAAIGAGLRYLKTIDNFALASDVDQLLELLSEASVETVQTTIEVAPAAADSDLLILRKAIANSKTVSCSYINATGARTQRELSPLRIDSVDPVWYLRAYCHKNKRIQTFRLDRMDNTIVLDQTIAAKVLELPIPDDVFTVSDSDQPVTLEIETDAYQIIQDFQAKDLTPRIDYGTKRVVIRVRNLQVLGPLVASYGGSARVLEPAEAIGEVRAFCLRANGLDAANLAVQ